jgi:hypothetical protein
VTPFIFLKNKFHRILKSIAGSFEHRSSKTDEDESGEDYDDDSDKIHNNEQQ